MSTLVDYAFYTDEYRAGAPNPPIPEESFAMFVRRAWKDIVNWKNIRFDNDFLSDLPEEIKERICEMAEQLFFRQQAVSGVDAEGEALVKSFSNKGYSEVLILPFEFYQTMPITEFENELKKIVRERFLNSEWHNEFTSAWAGTF